MQISETRASHVKQFTVLHVEWAESVRLGVEENTFILRSDRTRNIWS